MVVGLGQLVAAVDTHSAAYEWGRVAGALLLTATVFVRFFRRSRAQPKAVLLAIVGVLVALTIIGEVMLAAGLT
jgi:hypothetical protein